jgi:CDP-4-dehydro-6-deoxyglucose reductase, E3
MIMNVAGGTPRCTQAVQDRTRQTGQRIATIHVNTARHHALLRQVQYTNDRTKHFEFETANGSRFEFRPGQYISLDFNVNGERLVRAYSVASSPHHDNRFDLCLNIVLGGHVSPSIFDLKPGDQIEFRGPFGQFVLRHPADPVSAFIATGTGIAPLRSMIQYLFQKPCASEVWLIFGVREEADILYRGEFEQLASEHSNFHFIPTLSRPGPDWQGHTGYVQKQIALYLRDKTGFHAYVCGLKKMVNDVRQQLRHMGYSAKDLSCEKYD